MKKYEIKKNIYWVGAIDWNLRNFHGYLTQRGSSYNAYLIVDEKTVLIDTVKKPFFKEMLGRIESIIDPSSIDYVVTNHVEMDHSGALPDIMEVCPEAEIFTSPNGERGLKKHFGDKWEYKTVQTGDELNIGRVSLRFLLTQMVHWPDSMVTYMPEEKILFPNDAFGQHIASPERFDDEISWGIASEEAAKYYANIVLPYDTQVNKALDAIKGLDVDIIAPSHGVIWRGHVDEIIEKYTEWALNEAEEKAIIVYDTMWESTAVMAHAIYEAFEEKNIKAHLLDLKENHSSDIMTQLLTSKYICVGSPTLNSSMLPTVGAFLYYMKGLAPKGRTGLAFGSYGWGGQSIGMVEEIMASCGFNMMESLKVQYVPTDEEIDEIKEKVKGGIK